MWNLEFWKAVGQQAVLGAAYALLAALPANAAGLVHTDWHGLLSVAVFGAVVAGLHAIIPSPAQGVAIRNRLTTPELEPTAGLPVAWHPEDTQPVLAQHIGQHEAQG